MARLARLAIAGQAHHLIQRGNNGQAIFLDDEDRRAYLSAPVSYTHLTLPTIYSV